MPDQKTTQTAQQAYDALSPELKVYFEKTGFGPKPNQFSADDLDGASKVKVEATATVAAEAMARAKREIDKQVQAGKITVDQAKFVSEKVKVRHEAFWADEKRHNFEPPKSIPDFLLEAHAKSKGGGRAGH